MNSMKQFRTLGDIHRLRAEQFAMALVDAIAGMSYADIKAMTGLDDERCDEIIKARADAMSFLEIEKNGN